MIFPDIFAAQHRVWWLISNVTLAIALGFFLLAPGPSLLAVIYGGYWTLLLITVMFARALWRNWRADGPDKNLHLPTRGWPAVLVAGCGLVLLVHESYGFKILMDEIMLLGTSMSLHFDKTALVPMRGHDIQGAFQVMAGQLDKRPLFQPFLVSLLHDLTGYRPENVFLLNTALTFVLLALTYRVGSKFAGPAAGAAGVLLFSSLPLLAQNATGGGFEILNLVMILATVLLAVRFAERRDEDSLSALCLAAVLLALTRYESVLFIFPVGLLILWVWRHERRVILSWPAVFAPLLLLLYALHHKIFSERGSAWELAGQPGFSQPFSPTYAVENLGHAFNFLCDTSGSNSNSLTLTILGLLALPVGLLWLIRTLRTLRTAPAAHVALGFFLLGFAGHTVLMMFYFWGKFDDPVIRRLSLPLHLALICVVFVAGSVCAPRIRRFWPGLILVVLAGTFALSLPAMSRHGYSLEYYVGREMEWRREFMARHPERDYLFIDNNSIIWITHLVSATPVLQALQHKDNIVFNLSNRIFSAIYVFQRLQVDPVTGRFAVEKGDDLGPDYQLETVWERRFTPLTVSRICRVVSIREGPVSTPRPPPSSLQKMSPAEMEKIRQQYLDGFIKRLP